MFEKAEDEYNDLISKKNIIEVSTVEDKIFTIPNISVNYADFSIQNDKSKIKMVIEELDEKKKETLKVTWAKVNKSVHIFNLGCLQFAINVKQ